MESTEQNKPEVSTASDTQSKVEPQSNSENQPPADSSMSHRKNRTPFIIVAGLLLIGVAFFAFWFLQSHQTAKVATVAPKQATVTSSPKELVIGTDATLPPMEYTEKGKYVGYDIDLINALSQELGAQVTIKNIVFDNLFAALEDDQIDMIISAVTITDDRKKKYDFSDPYLNAGQVIITKKDNMTIKTTADLKGKKIAVQEGTTNEKEALLHTSPNLVMRYPDFVQATKALVNGQVDAVFNDLPGAKGTITDNPSLKIASDPFTNEYYGIVFRKGDPRIKEVNDALSAIKIKGILTDFKQKWLD
jgi:ABC-type amino acid transport substrate-binding protein